MSGLLSIHSENLKELICHQNGTYLTPEFFKKNMQASMQKSSLSPYFLSVVIPVFNELDNIASLTQEIQSALIGQDYEIIYVNDGSTDGSGALLKELCQTVKELKVIQHTRSFGQSVAMLTGIRAARGKWIATLDGDGQNDPGDIPNLLKRMQIAEDSSTLLIVGFRNKRQDTWLKRFSSKVANRVRALLLKDNTPDTGCGLKLFPRAAFLELPHFKNMHRFLPALFVRNGWQVVSVEVNHRPRLRGISKYGLHNRLWVGIVDLLGVLWLQHRPCKGECQE